MRLPILGVLTAQPLERPPLPAAGPKMLQANVMGGLKEERWKCGWVLQTSRPAGFHDPAQGFLSYVLSRRRVPQPPERKEPEPLAELANHTGLVRRAYPTPPAPASLPRPDHSGNAHPLSVT